MSQTTVTKKKRAKKSLEKSPELVEELKDLTGDAHDLDKKIVRINEIAKSEGFKEKDVISMVSAALEARYNRNQIYYILHKEKIKTASSDTYNKNKDPSTNSVNIQQNDDKKDIEDLKGVIAKQAEELNLLRSTPTEKYKDNSKELFEETILDRDKKIAELQTELAQSTAQEVKPDEEPDAEYLNDMAELRALRESKTQKPKDVDVGPFCPPESNAYAHPKNKWKELVAAMRHIGYDIQPLYKDGRPVASKARGFTIKITDGEFDGFFGIK